MIKRKGISRGLLFIFAIVILMAPAAAVGLAVTDGAQITATDGLTSPVITITDSEVVQDATITVDISGLNAYVSGGTLTDDNIVMDDTAANATWTGTVAGDTLTLTSTGGNTTVNETVIVTFTGAAGNAWVADTGGDQTVPLTAIRTDGLGESTFTFMIGIIPPLTTGLTVTDGEKITSPYGATAPVITIEGSDLPEGGTLSIDVMNLYLFVNSGTFTDANVVVTSDAANATWTGVVTGQGGLDQLLTLTPSGGSTSVGEHITVTFTGAGGNPWLPGSTDVYGDIAMPLTVTRTDTGETGTINFLFETPTPPPGGLTITDGVQIVAADGNTSPMITIADSDLPEGGTLLIQVPDVYLFVSSGTFSAANVEVSSDAAAATWTGVVSGEAGVNQILTLTSSGGPTVVGESITVTFTGAGGDPWIPDSLAQYGDVVMPLTVTRTDTFQSGSINFMIATIPPPGGLAIAEGVPITSPTGVTSPVITITDTAIAAEDAITIDVSGLNEFVVGGTFTDANVVVTDTSAASNWTGSVADNLLTLTSADGPTVVGENVTVTFTGAAGTAWIPNTNGAQTIPLTATRTDGLGTGTFSLVIEIAPPSGYAVTANFSASPTSGFAPLTVAFADSSLGNATSWSWDFGDGETSPDQNPTHTYTTAGIYVVSLAAANAYGSDTKTQYNYIHILNGGVREAHTAITGLSISNCGGSPQTIGVDTSLLPAVLSSDHTMLEIQTPADSGFGMITCYARDGVGFSQEGTLISGHLTGVTLVSEEIAPPTGFSDPIGSNASFVYRINLSTYPCNAVLSTQIWEGAVPEYDSRLRTIADRNGAGVVGTAFTARITRTNLPNSAPVNLSMSVNASWNPSLVGGPGKMFIWRIADDASSGQILPTQYQSTDPADHLDLFTADSPAGLSTFGISSFTGNNNPFQFISFIIQEYASDSGSDSDGTVVTQTTAVATTPVPPNTMSTPVPADAGITAKIFTNGEGITTQATTLWSTDGLARITLEEGTMARNSSGSPLDLLTIRRISAGELPPVYPNGALSFTDMAYDIQPDGATFSPSFSLSFIVPPHQGNNAWVVQAYDPVTGAWTDLSSNYDPQTGTLTTQVTHLCYIALFAQPVTAAITEAPTPTKTLAGKSVFIIDYGMFSWVVSTASKNPVILVIILAAAVLAAYFGWWRRRV